MTSSEPNISIITPVFNPPRAVLQSMLNSVRAQTSGAWEHCLVDDGSSAAHVRPMLQEAAAQDSRVRVELRSEPGGIVAATRDALEMARSEFVGFLDHDDELHREAVASVRRAIAASPDADYLYTDEDKIDELGHHFDPFLKPDWAPERFDSQMYTCHFSVARRALVESVGGVRPGFDGSQDWDLVFRVTERARKVVHIREVLYHWRVLASSVAGDSMAKPWAHDAARKAIGEHLQRAGMQAAVDDLEGYPGQYRIRPRLHTEPMVSMIIPTAGRVREVHGRATNLVVHTVRSIVERTAYANYEIVVVVDTSAPGNVVTELREVAGDRLRVVPFDRPFSYSGKINIGAAYSRGEYLLVLNDDLEVLWPGWRHSWPHQPESSPWVESLLAYATHAEIGSVGAKLYYADRRIQHVGIVTTNGNPGQPYRGFMGDYVGYFANAILPNNYLAVTGACLMTRRDTFDEIGGLSAQFPVNYQDVDYGLKLHAWGYRTVFTPEAELFHYEGSSRTLEVHPVELERLQERWRSVIHCDPYYHPRFVAGHVDFVHPPYGSDGTFLLPANAAPINW